MPSAENLAAPAPATAPSNKLLVTRAEAAAKLSISRRTLDYLIAGGKIQTVHIGRKCLIRVCSLERVASTHGAVTLYKRKKGNAA